MNYKEILELDEWELLLVKAHKKFPKEYPIDMEKFIFSIKEDIGWCNTGITLGENWHGGMSSSEWGKRKEYLESVLKECLDI